MKRRLLLLTMFTAQADVVVTFGSLARRLGPRRSLLTRARASSSTTYETKAEELRQASTLSLAPMMEYTDRHFRHLVRLISRRTLVYTEMVAGNALAHERRSMMDAYRAEHPEADDDCVRQGYSDEYLRRYLAQGRAGEGPSVLQLGGSDPQQLWEATQTVVDLTERGVCDYTALNLNCGCPSPKVAGKGCFGAALMEDPDLVGDLCSAMHTGCQGQLPVTVKCRVGVHAGMSDYAKVDDASEYRRLCNFIERVAEQSPVTDFQVHARIAILQKNFSPADNRRIPPLKYEIVQRLVEDYPEFTFSLNGGVETLEQVQTQIAAIPGLQGVMIGRAWAANPWSFAMADQLLYGETAPAATNRWQVLQEYGKHADYEEATGDPVKIRRFLVKAVSPLFAGEPNAKKFRIALDNDIGSRPKRLLAQGRSLGSEPPLSELILAAAEKHLSQETLLRSPQESYERLLWESQRSPQMLSIGSKSRWVAEWQTERKQQQEAVDSQSALG